ncbi:conserved hypothetical protein [uncultured delta proteobacterium]|uniref:Spore protein YkvP/CgeB glycosyl transferase-like domain-containing protein n=1 Tax=uncultured delta proteobacterium TaxID=34034 RepID=A0A212KBX6_9DELT|nr:conserved hypothetical protein [uncultured delta proteobacterium]
MRILNIDSMRLVPAFRALGHEVLSVGYEKECDIQITSPRNAVSLYAQVCSTGFIPDCAFWCDASNLPYLPGIEELPCVTAFYSIDTYCHMWHFGFANAFDAVFVAQKDHLPFFPKDTVLVRWLPLFAPALEESPPMEARDIPVSFVGTRQHPNNPDRKPFLDGFRRAHPLVVYSGPYRDIFSRSRIVLNQTACSEVNYRCFEALSCGTGLLMEICNHGLDELFRPGETILPLYARNNWAQAAGIAANALAVPERLAEIAANGRDLVARYHLARHRAEEVGAIFARLLAEKAPMRRLRQLETRRELLSAAYAMIGAGLTGRLPESYSKHYFAMSGKLTPDAPDTAEDAA